MSTKIQAIVFDFGGVLLDWNPRYLYRHFFPEDDEAMEKFLSEIGFMDWNALQDKGRSFQEGVAILSSQYPQYRSLIQAYHEHWEDSVLGEIAETVEIARQLKEKGYPLFGLSNWSAETFPMARRKYHFFDLFDDIVLSGEVKLIKPEKAIFHLLLKRIGKLAEECLLIDDSETNISVARELGFITIHYHSPGQLKSELTHFGIVE